MRFRQIRLDAGMKQWPFALRLLIPEARLKSYEAARAPIRYELAAKACMLFDVNQVWLARGDEGYRHLPFFRVHARLEKYLPARALFSEVFEKVLHPEITSALLRACDVNKCNFEELSPEALRAISLGSPDFTYKRNILETVIFPVLKMYADQIPAGLYQTFFDHLTDSLDEFKAKNEGAILEARGKEVREASFVEIDEAEYCERIKKALGGKASKAINPLTEHTSKRSVSADETNPPPTMSKKSIRQRLFSALESTRLTQGQFAEKFGLNRRSLENWLYREREPRGLYRERIETILSEIEGAKAGK